MMLQIDGTPVLMPDSDMSKKPYKTLYLEGPLGSGKSSRLRAELVRLLDTVPASSILVLSSNHVRQQKMINGVLRDLPAAVAQLPIYTYAGFVRNSLFNYWPLVEQIIAATLKRGTPRIRPELSGLEDSELMLRWLLVGLRREALHTGRPCFENFPGTEQHILKQLIRRMRLRSENQLTRSQMQERSALLDEMCRSEVAWLENEFDRQSYALRVLDANKQMDIFNRLLQQDNEISRWLKVDIRHLIVDDVDETIPAQHRLVEFLLPGLETAILAADVNGGSRRGYLNAYPYGWETLKQLRPGPVERLERHDSASQAAEIVLHNWKAQEDFQPLPPFVRVMDDFITRVEMLDKVVEDVFHLLEAGNEGSEIRAGDLALVLPKTDFLSFYQLQNRLNQRGIPVQLLSGTKRPSDNPKCRAFITLLQWANSPSWQVLPSRWEIKTVLMQALQMHYLPTCAGEALETLCQAISNYLNEATEPDSSPRPPLPPMEQLPIVLEGEAHTRYQALADWLQKAPTLPFDQQLYSAFSALLAPFASEKDSFADLNRMIQSYLRQREIYQGMSAGVLEPEQMAGMENPQAFSRWWLMQVKNGVMADTPETPEAVNSEALVIATPQKMIDTEVYRKVQFWLDIGSREWARSDNAPLYNAWVHSAVWDSSSTAFTEEFNEAIIRTRAGHIGRTLALLATEGIRAYASELNDLGDEQNGLLKPRLMSQAAVGPNAKIERATLRPDQAAVLNYQGGTLAISAVPGAGKTFVNVELLLELIERGVEPDSILVLTYMDSAAKTLLSRLKKKLAGHSSKLPVVSTIHSLALRLLTENDHSLLLGYHPDHMTILDDFARGELLSRVAAETLLEGMMVDKWREMIAKGIDQIKTYQLDVEAIETHIRGTQNDVQLRKAYPVLRKFCDAVKLYQQHMWKTASLDFTDLIIKAVELLQRFPDLREKYQHQFQYIIEDEAQDSSHLLQEFIGLLTGKRNNLIRTGDTNQSITTTFSSAETSIFRNFIREAQLVVPMIHSGRCAQPIIELANAWMREATALPGLEQTFVPVEMLGVPGQNPELLHAPQTQVFDFEQQEEEWLIQHIQAVLQATSKLTVAVLVCTNSQVNKITSLLHKAKIPAVGLSDQMNMNPVFTLILATLRLVASPGDLTLQSRWATVLTENHILPEDSACIAWMTEQPLVYAAPIDLTDERLKQWHYDFLDFGRQAAGGNISALIVRIVDRFCLSVSEKSNGYLCALMAQDILNAHHHLEHLSPLEIVIEQFAAFQRSWRKKSTFNDLLLQHAGQVVQVMTLHKSKGQEFDAVFMPFMQAKHFPHELNSKTLPKAETLKMELDRLLAKTKGVPFSDNYESDKKREEIEEKARLIYVGLTRAKRALYLSAHRQGVEYTKLVKTEPAMAFHILQNLLNPDAPEKNNVIPLHQPGWEKLPEKSREKEPGGA